MFDSVSKVGSDEPFFAEVSCLAICLKVCFQKLNLLSDEGLLLVILSVAMDLSEEGPVVKVIDGILKDGISGLVTLKLLTEPVGEGLHQLVCGVVWGCV